MPRSCSSSPPTGLSSSRARWRAAPAASTRRLPDEGGRRKLVRLYGRGLPLADAVVAEAARRTKGVSAAFIKELMRRIAQASIARDGGATVESGDIGEALDDMLFAGGKLNVRLLGGAQDMDGR